MIPTIIYSAKNNHCLLVTHYSSLFSPSLEIVSHYKYIDNTLNMWVKEPTIGSMPFYYAPPILDHLRYSRPDVIKSWVLGMYAHFYPIVPRIPIIRRIESDLPDEIDLSNYERPTRASRKRSVRHLPPFYSSLVRVINRIYKLDGNQVQKFVLDTYMYFLSRNGDSR